MLVLLAPALPRRPVTSAPLLPQDARQALTARKLQRVFEDVWDFLGLDPGRSNRRGRGLTLVHAAEPASAKPRGWLSGLFGRGSHAAAAPQPAARPTPRGLYMYGGVGVGKTMLMDLLVQSAPPEFQASTMQGHVVCLTPVHCACLCGGREGKIGARWGWGASLGRRVFLGRAAAGMPRARSSSTVWPRGCA